MDRTELAWAAGFWDGEGSAWLTRAEGRVRWQPQARINQSSREGVPEVLVRFHLAIRVGAIHGPELDPGREPLYRWTASSRADIEGVYDLVGPWLGVVKRAQLRQVLAIAENDRSRDFASHAPNERIAWAAGLWDGEGSVCLLKHRSHSGHFVPEASLTQSSLSGVPEVLVRIASVGAPGFVYGPFPQPPPWAPVYRWKLFRLEEIRALIELLRPWLGAVKVRQAENVFKVLDAQPKLPRGNPAWGSHKTHCVRGHEYAKARVRPFRGRGMNVEAPRASHQCLQCVREDARAKRRAGKTNSGG